LIGIVGDSAKVATAISAKLTDTAGDANRKGRKAMIAQTKSAWAQEPTSMTEERDDQGTDWGQRARKAGWLDGTAHGGMQFRPLCLLRRSSQTCKQLRHRQRLSVVQ
jgi:hypothetical protein